MQSRAVQLDRVEVFVLDEADRMLDMGFIHDIRRIVDQAAEQAPDPVLLGHHAARDRRSRQAICCATRFGLRYARGDHRRSVSSSGSSMSIAPASRACSLRCCGRESVDRVLVFTRTKRGADKVVRALAKAGLAAEAIHGNKSQNQRERVLAAFRDRPRADAGRHRYRGARHRRRRHQPRRSTTICRTFRRATCIASAAPRAPARTASRSRSARPRSGRSCATSRSSSACRSRPASTPATGALQPRRAKPSRQWLTPGAATAQTATERPAPRPQTTQARPPTNRHRRPAEAPAAAHGGEIGAIAFMQPKRRRPTSSRPPCQPASAAG